MRSSLYVSRQPLTQDYVSNSGGFPLDSARRMLVSVPKTRMKCSATCRVMAEERNREKPLEPSKQTFLFTFERQQKLFPQRQIKIPG